MSASSLDVGTAALLSLLLKENEELKSKVMDLEMDKGELEGELQGAEDRTKKTLQELKMAKHALRMQASRSALLNEQAAKQRAAVGDMVAEAANGAPVFVGVHSNVPVYLTPNILATPEAEAIMALVADPALAKATDAPVVDAPAAHPTQETATVLLPTPGTGDGPVPAPAPTTKHDAAVPAPAAVSGDAKVPAPAAPAPAQSTVSSPPAAPIGTMAPAAADSDVATDAPAVAEKATNTAGQQAADSGAVQVATAVPPVKAAEEYDPADLKNFDFDAEVVLGLKPRRGCAGARPAAAGKVGPRGQAVRGGWLRRCFGSCWSGSPAS